MLGENIKTLRKQLGWSQELIAEKLNVVRQTVSKWEQGLSVPDAHMLEQLAELFQVPVSTLLGSPIPEADAPSDIQQLARQLAELNAQLARQEHRRRQLQKRIVKGLSIWCAVILFVFLMLLGRNIADNSDAITGYAQLQCTLDGETYIYEVYYTNQYRIIAAGGDAWIADHVHTAQYSDANVLIAQIEDYFLLRGGTCEIHRDP